MKGYRGAGWFSAALIAALVAPAPASGQEAGETVEDRLEALERTVRLQEEQLGSIEGEAPGPFRVWWDHGIRIESADNQFSLRLGGRIQNDWAWFDQDDDHRNAVGEAEDGVEFRRARIFIQGTLYERAIFKAQYDFAGGDADFKDVYVGLEKIPYLGRIRVGQFYESFNLDELTSDNYITFLERASTNAFTPGRKTGIGVGTHVLKRRMTWALGGFRDTNTFGDLRTNSGGYAATGRLTGLPWYGAEDRLFHLGFATSYRTPPDSVLRYRARPEAHLAPYFVDTDTPPPPPPGLMITDARRVNLLGAEAAVVLGPVSLQGEFMQSWVKSASASDPRFFGYYAFASVFLTGEHRSYRRSSGTFGRLEPKENFLGPEGGPGAWELAGRFSFLDLTDENVTGGEMYDITAGLNWYLNPHVRVMSNYIYSDIKDVPGRAHIFQMRFQVDF